MYWSTTVRMMAEFSSAMVETRRQRSFIMKVQKKKELKEKDPDSDNLDFCIQ